ncbi:uncharacterized protein YecE (DUF72 family) [Actinocorallia herbida]|uniref:Uncharacterized protein YecE (DUF72 family) n=1 Tax=Actinocorallia herbida TaxID=58109 RepID=A0A3N1DAY0_9ACTN|nr:DUF72 domain-containing protein [Actinocorallia herbida]ROO90626.1 uncharacterized protein YecE (DUF72 family) [Actinocorallia herbida]
MWTLAPWRGRYVPHPLPAEQRLSAYASWCNAVEGNTTFYATPTRETAASWAAQTSPDFRLPLKLPRTVTHERRLTGAEAELAAFYDAVEPLGPRSGVLWIQLPGGFGPGDVGALATFLRHLPRTHRYAVEVRHRAFFEDERAVRLLERTLDAAGAEWVPFDTTVLFSTPPTTDAERQAWTHKPRMPRRSLALTRAPIVRYLGRDSSEETVAGWAPWVETVAEWLREGRSPTFFLHTPGNDEAPALARRFHDEVRARLGAAAEALAPLPEPVPPVAPEEPLTLF